MNTPDRIPGQRFLHSPGPTRVPDEVVHAMSRQPMDMGDPRLDRCIAACETGLKRLLHTERADVFMYAANGHGAWEAGVANLVAPGEAVLIAGTGHFSESWAVQTEALGARVLRTPYREGLPIDPAGVEAALRADAAHAIVAVFVVHTDTASGVTSALAPLRAAIDRTGHPALFVVDVVASLGAAPFAMDALRVDVALGASQKGLMTPPGLSFVAVGEAAMARSRANPRPRFYWDWRLRQNLLSYRKFCGTPPQTLLMGLEAALALIFREGEEHTFARHRRIADAVHAAVACWSEGGALQFFGREAASRSVSVTTVQVGAGVDPEALRAVARERFQVAIAGGLGPLAGRTFRIGHLGDINAAMILGALAGVEAAMLACGVPFGRGGVARAVEVLGGDQGPNARLYRRGAAPGPEPIAIRGVDALRGHGYVRRHCHSRGAGMRALLKVLLMAALAALAGGCASTSPTASASDFKECAEMLIGGLRPLAAERGERFVGKVGEDVARCRGGDRAAEFRKTPFVDWANYWATGDTATLLPGTTGVGGHFAPNGRGIDGALLDLEYQRMELIKFNLFDNNGTYADFVNGRDGRPGPTLKTWPEMRLPKGAPQYAAVGGDGPQLCQGELIRFRNLDGICNDLRNPRMGATGTVFARNAQFEATYPELGQNELARNRHGDRLGLLEPDPQLISRTLFTRAQSDPARCRNGEGLPGNSPDANCDYQKAPFFNVLAAFWIQFMTHDWFSHLEEGHNQPAQWMPTGCSTEQGQALGCRPGDRIDKGYVADASAPAQFSANGLPQLARAYKTHANNVTGWWDASQIYGYDATSRQRVKRDPADRAKLLLRPGTHAGAGEALGELPTFTPGDPINPQWAGQSAVAFPDNWTIGLNFYHTVFAREHNVFVDAFRKQAQATPDADSGLRNPVRPDAVIAYKDVSADELFEIGRLVIAAEIAKIHTTEWTPQLLYDEPLYLGMNANWSGLLAGHEVAAAALEKIVRKLGQSDDAKKATQLYSAFASGPGIFGLGNHVYKEGAIFEKFDPAKTDLWSLKNPEHVNGGINHFGSPFNFPEEFVTAYRLHALVPDLIEYREWDRDPNVIRAKVPVVETFRAKATKTLLDDGVANWALSMGRQRLGLLTLQNTPQFLQNLAIPRLQSATGKLDVAALDLIRDREHGVPRFNEFRRQYGLRQLTSYDDFVDQRLPAGSPERAAQQRVVATLREVYGQHRCDAGKVITAAQLNTDGTPIDDCLGHPNGTMVDNIEDVDTVVGWLGEFTRPHGYAISETQFQVFILNASRRLFSDRFFTSSFRPEFYTRLGVQWVDDNGPLGKVFEPKPSNGHTVEVSPLKRLLLRTIPELKPELDHVVNAFDPWGRDRGDYYSLHWKPRPDAQADPAFKAP